ncbi:hypothetical protein PC129_g9722 [Phytophthora cactorum]|uniref:Tc1-like transposase DDE domain-containing protein n=1 Tax=Phytophthora cactorum TaxID=29920 RepID=A0A8T1D849_9STRA|nr:hypothetical protein Pcac1_g2165 [Phytophthora cactorum]KAG2821411.1 hypothetical protein PC112_g11386 [Phytophthora cactorum]KAG2823892.1 hypothetical protein PC111_g10043 [Phytophthora cactorum]KAG2856087.1 hypothetical protein PC113_g11887 [Phytophthora cactorum]KAG2903087.1 hypothetical protein PC114_g12416 [Phytophthora cactorum]
MPRSPRATKKQVQHERAAAKQRVVRTFKEGGDWKLAAIYNDVDYSTARRAVLHEPRPRDGVRAARVKMTVEVMSKLEEYIDEDCRQTIPAMRDCLQADLGVTVSKTPVHRALQGMLYTMKKVQIEKAGMNNADNKALRREFADALEAHFKHGDMVVFHDETNFDLYLSRTQGWDREGERAVQLPASKGKNLHVQGAVSSGTGVVLMKTHDGSVMKEENACFVADLFVAAMLTDEYRELEPSNKVVIVTDNAPAHNGVGALVRRVLAEDGVIYANRLVILRLAPYSPMLNPIEGCWSVLKAHMKEYMAKRKEEFLVRGDYDTYVANRFAIMAEAVTTCKSAITRRLVWRMERHCLKAQYAAQRGEDMELGK